MDSTAVSIVAVATTGIATGIVGPAIVARATSRGQARKFRHERTSQDIEELRHLLDETCRALDEMIRHFAGVEKLIDAVGIGGSSTATLDELEEKVDLFEATSARLTIRVGPESDVAAACQELIGAVEAIQSDLTYLGIVGQMLTREGSEDENELAKLETQYTETIAKLFKEAPQLQDIRPQYVAAANRLAGAAVKAPALDRGSLGRRHREERERRDSNPRPPA